MTHVDPLAYQRDNGVPILQRSVVAFVDILGTSEHANAETAQETLVSLDNALRRARQQSGIDDVLHTFHVSWFSDNLSIAAPLPPVNRIADRIDEESSVGFTIVTLMWLQYHLAIDGFFLRGGITIGEQFADPEVNFGPALVEAARLENTTEFPRVVVDERFLVVVADHFRDHFLLRENPFHHELMRSPDGAVFISYLSAAHEAENPDEAHEMLRWHRAAVMEHRARNQGNAHVAEKYDWVARYHDAFCHLFFPAWDDLLIGDPGAIEFAAYVP